ncbi:MAG: ATP-binding protein [Candidatus Caenarcaniphilales bacterium]|nr:ATP-binding protein [Candidatus Caenarcaniphilales bacterium]
MIYVGRKLSEYCHKLAKQFAVILVTGARQAGKSTLLRNIFPNHQYLSLDDLRIRTQANESTATFLDFYKSPLIIDEVQYAPDLLSYIKIIVDEKKFKDEKFQGMYILTGSQKFELMDQIKESLAGRMAILNLNTLSIEELSQQEGDLPFWTECVYRSLYPEPFLNKDLDLRVWFETYVQSWLNRDIRQNLKNSHLAVFDKFLSLIATRISAEENFTDIAKELGVSRLTVQSWASLLEKTQVLYSLQPYHNNLGKRIIKSSKLYFLDTGLANYLSGFFTPEQISNSIMTGAFFENFIVTEAIKFFENRAIKAPISFFRDSNGLEVDLIIEYESRVLAIEIKSTDNPRKQHLKGLHKFTKLFDRKIETYLVCNSKTRMMVSDEVQAIPWQELPALLC